MDKNINFSRRNRDFKIINLELFSVILQVTSTEITHLGRTFDLSELLEKIPKVFDLSECSS